MSSTLYTIGHSNHEAKVFIDLLHGHAITAVVDVRSHPYSRYVPHFSSESLQAALINEKITYVFLGKELGARSDNPACYKDGKVQYDRLAQEPHFLRGLERVQQGMKEYRIALMCSEKDPLECHRAILIAHRLFEVGVDVRHIHADGSLESQHKMESRLLSAFNLPEGDMFTKREEHIAQAYELQEARIAYTDDSMKKSERALAV
jgi:uncharacterized protein (DUF488 family)